MGADIVLERAEPATSSADGASFLFVFVPI